MPNQYQTAKAPRSRFAFIRTDSFLEKFTLLMATAILSGILVPVITKWVDERRATSAALAKAQEKLYADVSEVLITYETLALDVSWFGRDATKHADLQEKAFLRYNERVVDLVVKWRIQISRAQTLASESISKKLDAMLTEAFGKQDTPIVAMWVKCGANCDWNEQHARSESMLRSTNALVAELAVELKLTHTGLTK